MTHPVSIHWFRQDLRLADNPALSLAAENTHVVPIYILDDRNAADFAMGEASRWWTKTVDESFKRRSGLRFVN